MHTHSSMHCVSSISPRGRGLGAVPTGTRTLVSGFGFSLLCVVDTRDGGVEGAVHGEELTLENTRVVDALRRNGQMHTLLLFFFFAQSRLVASREKRARVCGCVGG